MQRNLQLLCGFRAFQMTMFPIAIVPLYWRGELGFSMSEIFLLQALFGLFAACLEFPLGYVADRIGYRLAMLLATACSGTGWILLGVADGFWVVLLAELALAFSLSLTSGTDAALMYESLVELDREPEFARWFGRSRSIGAAAEGTAALAAGFLFAPLGRVVRRFPLNQPDGLFPDTALTPRKGLFFRLAPLK
ncbi:MAG: MFS transporter [Deltaproteobacteria bacterium]|nr:MFS transporter [Deltaproteobacteria bacterium]